MMAGIDKMYFNESQFKKFCEYISFNWQFAYQETGKILHFPFRMKDDLFVTNYPVEIDHFLWKHCPLDFVKEQLKEQYNDNGPKPSKYEPLRSVY